MARPRNVDRPFDAHSKVVLDCAEKITAHLNAVKNPQRQLQALRNEGAEAGVNFEVLELLLKLKRRKTPEKLAVFFECFDRYRAILQIDRLIAPLLGLEVQNDGDAAVRRHAVPIDVAEEEPVYAVASV